MTRPIPPWRYAPHPRLATIVLLCAWAIVIPALGLLLLGVVFSGPWDPDDLTGADWLAQADEYRRMRAAVLAALAPIALAALAATVGALVRRWWAPLVFAVPVWCAVLLVGFGATVGLEGSITTALERAAAPEVVAAPTPTPAAPAPLTEAEAMSAVRAGVARSFAASHPPVVFVDGVPVADTDVPIEVSPCEGGSVASARMQFSTADDIASEEAILDAWSRAGYARDRAAGTNLLYGAASDPIAQVTLRGTSGGLLDLMIASRCTTD